jgi:hypothetical protein
VVAGDESKEVEAQNERELRVLEAFYPGASSIPPKSVSNPYIFFQHTFAYPFTFFFDLGLFLNSNLQPFGSS